MVKKRCKTLAERWAEDSFLAPMLPYQPQWTDDISTMRQIVAGYKQDIVNTEARTDMTKFAKSEALRLFRDRYAETSAHLAKLEAAEQKEREEDEARLEVWRASRLNLKARCDAHEAILRVRWALMDKWHEEVDIARANNMPLPPYPELPTFPDD